MAGASTASAAAAPILASTTASSLAPQTITAEYRPAPGSAPAATFEVDRTVFSFSRGDRALPTTVWYPKGERGPFPLVLFSHGLTSQPTDYEAMLTRWAQAGFVVAGPTYPKTWYGAPDLDANDIVNQPADASHVIDLMLSSAGAVTAIIDADRIAAAGHSAGGITTTGLFSAHRDERLKAGIVQAGTDFQGTPFTGPAAAMLFVHGRKDTTVTYRAGHAVYAAVPWSRAMLSITDGGHVTESDDFEATTRTTTQFLRYALYGDPVAKAQLPTAAAVGGVATLESQL
ncbi:chlorophyllase-like protein [Actinoplanes sp. N902-109]|nr:chlorophyllase-like protein [Actinoplanes sp. N902-109]